jgi:hypothetical protein
VEREGADSLHGASRTPLRVPSFMDDVVSAMRQMGETSSVIISQELTEWFRHVCRGYIPEEREYSPFEGID